jgi:hypothetical protein
MKILPRFHGVGIEMLNPQEGGVRIQSKVGKLVLAMVLAFHLMSISSVKYNGNDWDLPYLPDPPIDQSSRTD